jgi:photosystem II stability/assembly factor-like uncharacterized protein
MRADRTPQIRSFLASSVVTLLFISLIALLGASVASAQTSKTPDKPPGGQTSKSPDRPPGTQPKSTVAAQGSKSSAKSSEGAPIALTKDHLRGLSWRPVGPANMGGRISEIALIPGKPRAAFVGTGTGGLFKTSNDGVTWASVFDDQPVVSIGSVAVARDSHTVYVGTGEGNGRNSSTWGDGVYKSTDGGGSFVNVGLKDSRDIPRLAIDPRDKNVVYAAALGHLWDANKERGLYRTSDGGKTWKAVLQIDENTGCVDVVLAPGHPEIVYAAMYARRRQPWSMKSGGFGDKGGIYVSKNGGGSFHRATEGLPKSSGRIGLAVSTQDSRHVFAVIETDEGGNTPLDEELSRGGGVYRSLDSGEHWERISGLAPRGFYFSKIVVDPKDEQRVYVLGYGLGVSDDGGRTFRSDGAKLPHGDLHTLVVDPDDRDHLWLGTDGGVYESFDRAETWRYHRNLATGEFYELSLGMDEPYTICGGLQDNGCWCGPSRGTVYWGSGQGASGKKVWNGSNEDWTFIWGGDGYYTAIDPRNANIRYAESQQGFAGRIDLGNGRVKVLRPADKEGNERSRFNWNSPLILSRHNPDVVYLGGNQVYRIVGATGATEAISPDLSSRDVNRITTEGSGAENFGTVVTLAESPLSKGVLWAGTDDGRIWLTRDDGKNWTEATGFASLVPKGTYVSRIEPSHFVAGAALASFDGHRTGDNRPYVLETKDGGKSWKKVTGDLPDGGPVRVVREDLVNEQLLFVGTEFGAFVSVDRGAHWLSLRPEGFPAVQFHDLQIHPRDRDLVAATHGRSIYVMDDITGLEHLTPDVTKKAAALLEPRPARGYYMRPRGGMWGDDQYGVKSPAPGATFNYWVRERNRDGAKLTVKDSTGHVVRELDGPAEAGLNRATWDLGRDPEQRYDPPEAGFTGQFVFVPAGTYDVELKVGKETSKQKLVVRYPKGVGPQ